MPIFNNALAGAAGSGGSGFKIERSLRFNSADSAYLNRTPSSAGNRKTWTWSGRIKKGEVIASGRQRIFSARNSTTSNQTYIQFRDDNKLYVEGPNIDWLVNTDAIFRDLGAWGHLVVAFDTTQATASNRVRVYWNGVEQALSGTQPSQDYANGWINNTFVHSIGNEGGAVAEFFNGYLAQIHFVDGQQLAPTNFGEFDADTGVWNPIKYSGTYGTNGFHLDFSDNSSNAALGTDSSGNNNTWTVNNLSARADGLIITSVKAYSVYNGASVSSNYTVDYSDDGSSWTTAFSGVMDNGSACGIFSGTNPGNGSYGAHKYWRYVVGSAITSHHPRVSRIMLSDGTSDYEIANFGSDNCSDSGGIPSANTVYSYTFDASSVDSLLDSPTNYDATGNNGGNYATLNPLIDATGMSNGNLDYINQSATTKAFSTIAFNNSDGPWYWEVLVNGSGTGCIGFSPTIFSGNGTASDSGYNFDQQNVNSYLRLNGTGISSSHSGYTGTSGSGSSPGDIWGMGVSGSNWKIWKNGTLIFDSNVITQTGNFFTWLGAGGGSGAAWSINYGQRPFSHPQTGYKSLCTQNLADPLIAKGSNHFDVSLWTGNGVQMTVGGPVYSATSTMSSPTNAFNGDESNGAIFNNANVLTSSPITITSSLQIKHNRNGGNGITVNINGTNYTATGNSNSAYHTIPIPNSDLPLTSTGNITVTDNDGSSTLYAVKVDGSVLIDGNGDPLDFSPDFVWLKSRSTTAYHMLFDTQRGAEARLHSNTTTYEQTGNGDLTAFNSNGYTLDNATGSTNTDVNGSGTTYVGWAWDGGDLATNSAYNQSKVWSSFWSATGNGIEAANPATQAHDGILTGLGMRLNASSSCTWAPTGGYSYTGDFLIYCCKDNNYTGTSWTCVHAGGTLDFTSSVAAGTTQTAVNLTSLGVQSPITSISFTSNNNGNPRVSGMSADGKILVDAGLVPVGSLNSSFYNQDQQWSNGWTGNSGTSGRVPTNAFNGDLSNWAFPGNNNANEYVEYSFTAINVNTSLEFYLSFDAGGSQRGQLWVNDTNVTSQLGSGNAQWYTVTGQSTLSKIKILTTATNYYVNLHAVRVDGKILVDNNVTPPTNYPSIASTVRANQTAGFSIVTYSQGSAGSVVAHGLNKKPEMIIAKSRTNTNQPWVVYHSALGKGGVLQLHNTAENNTTYPTYWGSDEPDSSVFGTYTGSAPWANNDGNMLAYCFTSIEGYSSVSSYTAGTNKNFIYLGFRPAFLICKKVVNTVDSSYEGWVMFDSERGSYNINQKSLYSNTTYIEGKRGNSSNVTSSDFGVDFLSNGFSFNDSSTEYNRADSSTYVYYAVAENPFKIARAR